MPRTAQQKTEHISRGYICAGRTKHSPQRVSTAVVYLRGVRGKARPARRACRGQSPPAYPRARQRAVPGRAGGSARLRIQAAPSWRPPRNPPSNGRLRGPGRRAILAARDDDGARAACGLPESRRSLRGGRPRERIPSRVIARTGAGPSSPLPAVSPIGGARYSAGCVGTHQGPTRERRANEGGTARLSALVLLRTWALLFYEQDTLRAP